MNMTSPPGLVCREQDPNEAVEERTSSRLLATGLKSALSLHGLPCKSGELLPSTPPPHAPVTRGAASNSASADAAPRADCVDPGQSVCSDWTGEPEAASLVAGAQAFAALEAKGGGGGGTEGLKLGIQRNANKYGRLGAWHEAVIMLSLLEEENGLVHNYNATIAACEKAQQYEAALMVWMHMCERSVRPNIITIKLMKRAMNGLDHLDVFLCQEMHKHDLMSIRAMMQEMPETIQLLRTEARIWEQAFQFSIQMRQERIIPSVDTYTAMIRRLLPAPCADGRAF